MQFLKQTKSQTPESVELAFTLAGVGNRTVALVVDYLLWSIVLIVSLVVFAFLYSSLSDIPGVKNWLVALQILLFFAIYVGYFVFFETLWRGQTPGKRYAKIRVIREDGRNAGLPQAILRSLLRVVDELLFIGLLLILFTKQEKRLGDWVAGTLVIQEGQVVSPKAIDIQPAAQAEAMRLMDTGKMGSLTPDDFAAIRRYLQRYPFLSQEAKYRVSDTLVRQIREITHLEPTEFRIDNHLLIQAVYLVCLEQFKR
jgi:uncharacterized RDD family membrane protein YckC